MNRWPLFLGLGLSIVVFVNIAFVWIAVSTAPEIEPTYSRTQDR